MNIYIHLQNDSCVLAFVFTIYIYDACHYKAFKAGHGKWSRELTGNCKYRKISNLNSAELPSGVFSELECLPANKQ